MIYRRGQALPYRLSMLTIGVWFVIAAVGALVARLQLGFDLDDTIILSVATLILALAGAIYEQLWHREVLRPLLAHLTQRYRVMELTPALFAEAMLAARKHRLRAYDAVQLAVVLEVHRLQRDAGLGPVTLISADRGLNTAAAAEGLAVEDPTMHP